MQINLEGPRIRLRELRLTDLIDVYVNIRDKEIGRWSLPPASRFAQNTAGQFVWRFVGHVGKTLRVVWQMLFPPKVKSEFKLGIVLRETGRVVGIVTLSQIDQQKKSAQIGFWIGKRYWGRGLTTESINLALKFVFGDLKLDRIDAWTFENNIGSKKVMEKCGLKLEGVIKKAYFKFNEYHDKLNYSILRSEWDAQS
ncbi:MAG: GNAT family N-acetyltransferase [Planctomycetota bacterium]|jgi:RimJ/RimL family protein N-acetyltransferase